MRMLVSLALAVLVAAGWFLLRGAGAGFEEVSGAPLVARAPVGRSAELAVARQRLERGALDEFVAEQESRVRREPEVGEHWRVLAEACLERALLADLGLGLSIGKPNRSELPPEVEADVERGMQAIERALEIEAGSSEAHRVECALLSRQIVGIGSLLRLNGRIDAALARARELDPSNARVLVAIGCRKLFAPRKLGHDPEGSLRYLEAGAAAMVHDERPLMYAAFAEWVVGRRERARKRMEEAVRRTPANPWAREVLGRLVKGEEDAFREL